jgi:beta-glucosidase/6-phospho-beta-glucosidase/beta-galactosidase
MDPLIRGEYPMSMRVLVGNRLPRFTKGQSDLVKGSFDFIGLNYYTANYADNLPPSNGLNTSYNTDSRANLTGEFKAKDHRFFFDRSNINDEVFELLHVSIISKFWKLT